MKRLLSILPLVALTSSWLTAQDLTPEERKRAADHLEKTSAAFLSSVEGLSETQLNFKPAPERWSVAEVAEHIAAAEDMLRGMVESQVLQAPARTEPANLPELDTLILTAIPDRTQKRQAPEPLVPTRRFGSVPATIQHFKESRAQTLALLAERNDLRAHATDSPLGQKLDAYQWLLFLSAHCERHTKQINEVKADPHFPRS